MAVNELFVGNLNIVFLGEKGKFDLLDFWDEFVFEVFQDDVSWGNYPKYLLKDIQLLWLNKKEPAIIGRFVKSTVLTIKQVLKNNELVPKDEKHASAPSSVFVYLLKNHVLLYWGEHPGNPAVRSFKTFLGKCINRARKQYIRVLRKGKTIEEKLEILEKYPEVYSSYIPLPLTKSLEAQFSDIVKISRLSVRQYYQNANINYKSVLSTNQSLMDAVKSSRIDYSLVGIGDIDGTKQLVGEIAKAGESQFSVSGKTEDGKKVITNEGVQYSQLINTIGENEDIVEVAEKLFDEYRADVVNGDIPDVPQKNTDAKIRKVVPR